MLGLLTKERLAWLLTVVGGVLILVCVFISFGFVAFLLFTGFFLLILAGLIAITNIGN